MMTHPPALQTAPTLTTAEVRSIFAVSVAFFLMAAAGLSRLEWRPPEIPDRPERDRVRVRLVVPPPTEQPPINPLMLERAAASATNPDPNANLVLEQAPEAQLQQEVQPRSEQLSEVPNPDVVPPASMMSADPTGLRDMADVSDAALKAPAGETPGLTPEQVEFLARELTNTSAARQELEQQRQLLAHQADLEYAKSRARQLSFRSAGYEDGVTRRLDLRGVPEEKLRRVLDRHGISMREMRVDTPMTQQSPLGSVQTDQGEYHTSEHIAPGYYEVLQMSSTTFHTIARLENQYMRKNGLDPEKTKWIAVTFSVQHVGGTLGYDLVITDAEYETIR